MPRTCTICNHDQRPAVEAALVGNEPLRNIAARYGTSTGSLQRHKSGCVPGALANAQDAAVIVRGNGLLGRITQLADDARRIQKEAERSGDLRTALLAIRELSRIVEMLTSMKPAEPRENAPLIRVVLVGPTRDVGG